MKIMPFLSFFLLCRATYPCFVSSAKTLS